MDGLPNKVVCCRLKTGGKSIDQIREHFNGQGMTYRDFENLKKMYDAFEGLNVTLSLWNFDNCSSYHLYNWKTKDDATVMNGVYYAEQTHPFPRYKDDYPRFRHDWETGHYDFGGASLTFSPEDVEELEVIFRQT